MGFEEECLMSDKSKNENIPPGFTLRHTLRGHEEWIAGIAWSPDGKALASPSRDQTICIWNLQTGRRLQKLIGHKGGVLCTAWSPDGLLLASCSADQRIYLWSPDQTRILEGHTESVISVSFSSDGHFLASKSGDGTVRIWSTNTWEVIAVLKESVSEDPNKRYWDPSLAFHPKEPILATLGEKDTVISTFTPSWEPLHLLLRFITPAQRLSS
jgi:WD40 repeat protein